MTRDNLIDSLAGVTKSQARLQAEVGALGKQLTSLQGQINEDLIRGETSAALPELEKLKMRKGALEDALAFAGERVKAAQQELDSFDRAQIYGQAADLDKKLTEAVWGLLALIGENGLKGKLDDIYDNLISPIRSAGLQNGSEPLMDADRAMFIWANLTNALLRAWREIEGTAWGQAIQDHGERDGFKRGFGRIP